MALPPRPRLGPAPLRQGGHDPAGHAVRRHPGPRQPPSASRSRPPGSGPLARCRRRLEGRPNRVRPAVPAWRRRRAERTARGGAAGRHRAQRPDRAGEPGWPWDSHTNGRRAASAHGQGPELVPSHGAAPPEGELEFDDVAARLAGSGDVDEASRPLRRRGARGAGHPAVSGGVRQRCARRQRGSRDSRAARRSRTCPRTSRCGSHAGFCSHMLSGSRHGCGSDADSHRWVAGF